MDTPPVGSKKPVLGSLTKTSLTPCRRLGLSRPSPGSSRKSLPLGFTPNKNDSAILDRLPVQSAGSTLKNSVAAKEVEKHKVPLRTSDSQNKSSPLKVRQCLAIESSSLLQCEESSANKSPKYETSNTNKNNCSSDVLSSNVSKEVNSSRFSKRRKLSLKVPIDHNLESSKVLKDSSSITVACTSSGHDNSLIHEDSSTALDLPSEKITPEVIEKLVASIKEKKERLELLKVQEAYAKKHDLEVLRAQTKKWVAAGKEALRYSVDLARQSGYSVTIKELMIQHGFPGHLMGYNSEDDEFE